MTNPGMDVTVNALYELTMATTVSSVTGPATRSPVPLDGTNVDEGRRILREANVPGVHMAKNMVEGAKLAVELAKEKKLQARIKG